MCLQIPAPMQLLTSIRSCVLAIPAPAGCLLSTPHRSAGGRRISRAPTLSVSLALPAALASPWGGAPTCCAPFPLGSAGFLPCCTSARHSVMHLLHFTRICTEHLGHRRRALITSRSTLPLLTSGTLTADRGVLGLAVSIQLHYGVQKQLAPCSLANGLSPVGRK